MRIGIIDADLLGRQNHRFPNLACEKISGYWKEQGAEVCLLSDYKWDKKFNHIYVSKVFTDTPVPNWLKETKKVHLGGTGFFFGKAPDLPNYIEHHMPDYHLYDDWINEAVLYAESEASKGEKPFDKSSFMIQFKEYTDYSIGFITRGCFRKCKFCVNQKYDHVFEHSRLSEFYDPSRKKICLLDDNFLGCTKWQSLLKEVIATNHPFKFKQGIDERILTDKKCNLLFSSKYDGDMTFAFDNVADYDLIRKKLIMIRNYSKSKSIKFYVLVGFESIDATDIANVFKRLELLMQFKCLPYIMRYQNENYCPWKESKYRGMYITLARWCNQPSIFKKMSFRQFCTANQALHKTKGIMCSSMRAMSDFETEYPDVAKKYFDLRFEDFDL